MTGTVALYARISKDAEGRAEGVATQERKGRKLAADLWPGSPIRVFVDNDLTAADPDVVRPGFEELLTDVRRGNVAHIVAAEQSRLTRRPAEWEDLAVTLARAGIKEVNTYRSGAIPVAGSRLLGRILSAVDAEEVERTKARINDKLDALAAEGRPAGGGSYGYRRTVDPDGRKALEVDPERAEVIRWAAGRVLAGWSLASIVRDLEARNVPTARGGKWSTTTIKSMLRSPTIAGLRVHRGEVVRQGTWEPILDPDEWRQVVAALTSPQTVTRSDGSAYAVSRNRRPARRYLLTGGLAICGKCGAPMVAQQRRSRAGGRSPSYLCHPTGTRPDGTKACSGIGIGAEPFEDFVVNAVLAELNRPDFLAHLTDEDDDDARGDLVAGLDRIDARRADLARLWAAGDLSGGEWEAARAQLERDRQRIEGDLADLPARQEHVDYSAVVDGWAGMTLDERREVLRLLLAKVTVLPAKPGTRRFDPERVAIEWRVV